MTPKALWCKEKHLPGNGVKDVPSQLEFHHTPTIIRGIKYIMFPHAEHSGYTLLKDVTPTKRVGICVYLLHHDDLHILYRSQYSHSSVRVTDYEAIGTMDS